MEILSCELVDLALYVDGHLIVGDFHMGYEEALNKQGILMPRFQFKDTIKRLEKIFAYLKEAKKPVKKVVCLGDIKHEFGHISEQEWRDTLALIDYLLEHGNELVLLQGNHDTVLGPIAEKRGVQIMDDYMIGEILVLHGDVIPEDIKAKTIIIGHEHPCVTLRLPGNVRVEKYKAFLKGGYKKHNLIVIPSFNLVTEGTDVIKQKLLSPFLKQNIKKFEAFLVADKIYAFGKLTSLASPSLPSQK